MPKKEFARLNRKSDVQGFLQTLGYLAVLLLTGTLACLAVFYTPWYVAVLAFLIHGTCSNFLINGFHELLHESVFKTRQFNRFFVPIFSFLGWYNHIHFRASHTEHHKFTLHPPDDLEVVAPHQEVPKLIARAAIVDPIGLYEALRDTLRLALGRLHGIWEHHLFDQADQQLRQQLFGWARVLLVGHGLVVLVALATGWWPLILTITLGRFYGGALFLLCNNAQHTGLQDNVADFRVCCRTIYLNPIVEFLYWRMNYHTEHHMYPGVPCYNLAQLHQIIKPQMPPTPRGLLETWQQILPILQKQAIDPSYRYIPPLPTPARGETESPKEQ